MAECIIVVPCYNEAQRLDLGAFINHAAASDEAFLFVNDGSTDATADVLDDLCAAHPASLTALHLPQNGGKAEAVRQGMLAAIARGASYAGYWDADLATPLEAIYEFRDHLRRHPQVELVMGARVPLLGRAIERRPSRHMLGRWFAAAAGFVLRLRVYDTQCGAKLFRVSDRVRAAFAEPFATRWIFDVELLARLLTAMIQDDLNPEALIYELPLTAWRDVAGSKLKAGDFARAALQLGGIYRRYPALRQPRPTSVIESATTAPAASSDRNACADVTKTATAEVLESAR